MRLRLLALIGVLALLAAACSGSDDDTATTDEEAEPTEAAADDAGGDDEATEAMDDEEMAEDDGEEMAEDDGEEAGASSGGTLSDFDLSGVEITVGSKDFAEQLVLSQIYIQALEAAGATVTDESNTGGTNVARDALVNGDIDVYPEYNGTGWTVHLGNEDPVDDPDQLTEMVREEDIEENSIRWIDRAPFNNTYGFAVGPDFVEENGELDLQGMADYLAENPDATVCMEQEFPSRPDGLVLFEEATGFTIPQEQQEILGTEVIYTETAEGGCTFGEIFTTDGRIPFLELDVIDDPGVFILYNISATMRDEVYQNAPEDLDGLFSLIHEPLDIPTMAELNRQVSVDGEDPADVAAGYLEQFSG
ncbi:glycine betaine ABC transporter substrate-binding protein [Euzebya tangerina]|uniref:glycine betaine ABC transporter substrate-binding protein n=1 Tax=Euzebya tangerina TaxID=591198 RepID=UPI00196A43B9|nr:glycine betaine ABC transporter substrate-binding protein [Euzebya tangerina]